MSPEQLFELHIETLKVVDKELDRLHNDLANGYNDEDQTQSQIGDIHNSLNQLNVQLTVLESQLIEGIAREKAKS